eukprot:m.106085 g.106085  ORF g.106085 m.106085 type:complete len:648 (-) comp27699_c0_seq1:105-2048(-)
MAAREKEVCVTWKFTRTNGGKGPYKFLWDYFMDTFCKDVRNKYNTEGCTRVEGWKTQGTYAAILQVEFQTLKRCDAALKLHAEKFGTQISQFHDGEPSVVVGPLATSVIKRRLIADQIQSIEDSLKASGVSDVKTDAESLAEIAPLIAGAERKYVSKLKDKKLEMSAEGLNWLVGFQLSDGKYLTQETFGFNLNALADKMKKKQIWHLEHVAGEDAECINIKSHLGKYLSAMSGGETSCEADTPGENEMFRVEAQLDGTWGIKSSHAYYLGGSKDQIKCFDKVLARENKFKINIAQHPQVVLQNVLRKEYLHLDDGIMITSDEKIPWGADALVTLCFLDDGRYALMAEDGKYVTKDGQLSKDLDETTMFVIEFFGGKIALKTSAGKYLTPFGGNGLLKDVRSVATAEDVWMLEDSEPQIKLKTHRGRRVSIRAGIEISSHFGEAEDPEIFQIEPIDNARWRFKTHAATYWSMTPDGKIVSNHIGPLGDNETFNIEWAGPKIAMKAANGKYLVVLPNGCLKANGSEIAQESSYIWEIINRPKLVLRGELGFVGTTTSGSVECNKSHPQVFTMHVTAGMCKISNSAGKFWGVEGDRIKCNSDEPTLFTMQLKANSKLTLHHESNVLFGAKNGMMEFGPNPTGKSSLFEF